MIIEQKLDEYFKKKKIESAIKNMNSEFSSYGTRLFAKMNMATTTDDKLNINMAIGLVILAAITGDKSLANKGLKISSQKNSGESVK